MLYTKSIKMEKINNYISWMKNKIFRPTAIKLYKEALHNEKLSIKELNKVNWEKRVKIVEFAYNNIPFYKEYYDANKFHPNMLKKEEDWNLVPILEKSYVRKRREDLINPKAPQKYFVESTTGGSTGTPMKVFWDKRFKIEITGWRAFTWWKVSPADNIGIIHRRVPKSFWNQLKNRAIWWPTQRIYLNAVSMTDNEIEDFVKQINKRKIVWLQGYVGALERIADYIIKHNIKITSLQLIWSTSAPLLQNVRAKLEQAFQCKIMNQYGSNEVSNIAQQCPYSPHLHIHHDFVHVDIVNSNGKIVIDEEGEILVTNLTSYVFPLIKYRLGDRGTKLSETCNCGCNLPLMKEVKGRISDAIYTPNGLYVDGNYLNSVFDNYYQYFDQFQIYQKKDYSITVYIKIKQPKADNINQIIEKIKSKLDNDVRYQVPISIEEVNNIKDDKGKIRYIISELSSDIKF